MASWQQVCVVLAVLGAGVGACVVVNVDTTDTLTDVSLSDILTDGFTQTSNPTIPTLPSDPTVDPTVDPTETTTETTVDPTIDPPTTTETTITTEPTVTTDPTIDPGFCGNGVIDDFEQCDDGNGSNEDGCLGDCTLAFCGDGFVQTGVEACDDGNFDPSDGCDECQLLDCGDGVVQAGEECDDANQSNTDACLNTCAAATCGDGFVQAGVEQCDDGNTSNTDTCVGACVPGVCGDGFVQSGTEDCDDANDNPDDGCDQCSLGDLPPECEGITVLDEESRNLGVQGPVECDLELPAEGQWTRFVSPAGTTMPTSAPAPFACGTHAPGWLNGAIPAEADGIVARDVCFSWDGNTCNWKVPISVRNCGPFVMFKLAPVPTCALRYCSAD